MMVSMISVEKWTRKESGADGTSYLVKKILERQDRFMWRRSNAGYIGGLVVGSAGWPDYDLIDHSGRYIALECKGYTGKNRMKPTECSRGQRLILQALDASNCLVWIVRDPAKLLWILDPSAPGDMAETMHLESKHEYAGPIDEPNAIREATRATRGTVR